MPDYVVRPWRQKDLNVIWKLGFPLDFFQRKSDLLQFIRLYRKRSQAEVYTVAELDSEVYLALLFVEPDFLDQKTLVAHVLELNQEKISQSGELRDRLFCLGQAFYKCNPDFAQIFFKCPLAGQKVIPGNAKAYFMGNAVYPNKLEVCYFAGADFIEKNYLIFLYKDHHIIVTCLNNEIIGVSFVKPKELIVENELKKSLVRACLLNDEGWIDSNRQIIKVYSKTKRIRSDLELEIIRQFSEYFSGQLQDFNLPYKLTSGTPFQRKVWQVLSKIPYGQSLSYQEVAEKLTGDLKQARDLARAVGYACKRNPMGILIPCHRVIGKDNTLTGFGGGLALKAALLDLEFLNRSWI